MIHLTYRKLNTNLYLLSLHHSSFYVHHKKPNFQILHYHLSRRTVTFHTQYNSAAALATVPFSQPQISSHYYHSLLCNTVLLYDIGSSKTNHLMTVQ